MTIHLSDDWARFVHAEVASGRFASEQEVVEASLRLLQQRDQSTATEMASGEGEARDHKPIWEVAAELRKTIPEEEWLKLPVDGAEQLDHYIYGSPKRRP